jgi:hypothetical protein
MFWFCFVRHSMVRFSHWAFWFFSAEIRALKNLSASTLYFMVRSARYSVGYSLLRIVFFSLFLGLLGFWRLFVCGFFGLKPSDQFYLVSFISQRESSCNPYISAFMPVLTSK